MKGREVKEMEKKAHIKPKRKRKRKEKGTGKTAHIARAVCTP